MVHKNNCRDSKRISIGGRVRLIKCPYNVIDSVQLSRVKMRFVKTALSHSLQRFSSLKFDSSMW